MARADCRIVEVTPDTVFLEDLDRGGRIVTNDATAVVREVTALHPRRGLVYRDSEGSWCELRHDGRGLTGFAPWTGATPRRAVI